MSACALLVLLLAVPRASAQDQPVVAPDAPAVLPVPLGEAYVWELTAHLGSDGHAAGIAVQPADNGAWVAVDERGGIWISEDLGAHWQSVLPPLGASTDDEPPSNEKVLLEAEAAEEDALDDDPVEVDDGTSTDTTTTTTDVTPDLDAATTAIADAAAAAHHGDRARDALPLVWFDPADATHAYVARADGLWRSRDEGYTWEQVQERAEGDPAITCLVRGTGGDMLVAGTTDGVQFSLDGGAAWIDVVDATDGGVVHQIVQAGTLLWAATSTGLYNSADGLHWTAVTVGTTTDVRSVVPDPSWPNGFWVAAEDALYRTDDGGATFYVTGRQPFDGLRRMVHPPDPGHLLAISNDGVWESMDGGIAWAAADARLTDPDVRDIAFADGRPVIATPDGIWRMAPGRDATAPRLKERTLSLSATVQASITRPGLDIDLLSLAHRGTLAAVAPQLELRFDWDSSAARRSSVSSASTTDSYDGSWKVGARICWGNCGNTVTVDYDSTGSDIEVDSSLYAVDGQVFTEGEPVAAAANVATRIRNYRRDLADEVSDAWLARQHLVADAESVRTLPLRDQVLHALQLQELDARLDAYTDGAFTRSITRTSEDTP